MVDWDLTGLAIARNANHKNRCPHPHLLFSIVARIAQLVEQLICNQQVVSSSLTLGSTGDDGGGTPLSINLNTRLDSRYYSGESRVTTSRE